MSDPSSQMPHLPSGLGWTAALMLLATGLGWLIAFLRELFTGRARLQGVVDRRVEGAMGVWKRESDSSTALISELREELHQTRLDLASAKQQLDLAEDRIGDLQRDVQRLNGENAQLHQVNESLVRRLEASSPGSVIPPDSKLNKTEGGEDT